MVRIADMIRCMLRIFCTITILPAVGCGGDEGGPNGGDDAADCGWDAAPLDAPAPDPLPTGQSGDLAEVLPGAWQHTHIITGGGSPEPLLDATDIRFVFSSDQLLYCQDTQFTGRDSNRASYELRGNDIVLPRTAGYTAAAWTADVMIWDNNTIPGEQFLLQRR